MRARAWLAAACLVVFIVSTGCFERTAYRRWKAESAPAVAAFEQLAAEKQWRFVVNGTELFDPASRQFRTVYSLGRRVDSTSAVNGGRLALIEEYYEPKEPVGQTKHVVLVVIDIAEGAELARVPLELAPERILWVGPPIVLTGESVVFAEDRQATRYDLTSMRKETVLTERADFDITVIEESDQFYCVVREKTYYTTEYELILIDKKALAQNPAVYPGVSNVLVVSERVIVEKDGAIFLLDPSNGQMQALTDGTLLTAAGDDAFLHTGAVLERFTAQLMVYRFFDGESSPLPAVVQTLGMYKELSQPVVSPDGAYVLVGKEYAWFYHGHIVEYDFRLIELATGRDMGSAFYSRYLGKRWIGPIDDWLE